MLAVTSYLITQHDPPMAGRIAVPWTPWRDPRAPHGRDAGNCSARQDLPDELSRLPNLVVKALVHSDDHGIGRLDAVERSGHPLLYLTRRIYRSAGSQDFVREARFPALRIVSSIRGGSEGR